MMPPTTVTAKSGEFAVRRILVTRLRYLGDIVLSTPVLDTLRERCPEASIEYLCFDSYAEPLRHHPSVDVVHALPSGAGPLTMLSYAARLRRPRVDWWIDLFGNPRSALLCLLARPRASVGTDRGLRSRVFDHRLGTPAGDPSAVAHHLHKLFPLLGEVPERPVRIACDPESRARARTRFGIDPARPPLLLHPGSTWPSKAWPERKWAQLVEILLRESFGEPWILTAPGQEASSRRIVDATGRGARLLEALPLEDLLPLIAESRAYLGNDGGVLHAAVALGTPSVGLFGPTEPEIWFPHEKWGGARLAQEFVPCRPCHLHHCDHLSCLEALPVERVVRLLRELLRGEERMRAHG